jgi:hypothetical protein
MVLRLLLLYSNDLFQARARVCVRERERKRRES